jgi:hypothetical protein
VTPEEESQLKTMARFFKISNEGMKKILADEVGLRRESRRQAPSKSALLQFSKACKDAWADGEVTAEEQEQLRNLAKFLKIPSQTVKRIFRHEGKVYQKAHSGQAAT